MAAKDGTGSHYKTWIPDILFYLSFLLQNGTKGSKGCSDVLVNLWLTCERDPVHLLLRNVVSAMIWCWKQGMFHYKVSRIAMKVATA